MVQRSWHLSEKIYMCLMFEGILETISYAADASYANQPHFLG